MESSLLLLSPLPLVPCPPPFRSFFSAFHSVLLTHHSPSSVFDYVLLTTHHCVLQQVRLLAIDRLTPVDTLSTRPLPGGVLSPLEIGKNALDKASRAIDRAERARRAQKGSGGRLGGDPLDEEGGYPHYDLEGQEGEGRGNDDYDNSGSVVMMDSHSPVTSPILTGTNPIVIIKPLTSKPIQPINFHLTYNTRHPWSI